MIKWFKSRGFTDRLYFLNLLFAWFFTVFCMVITVLQSAMGLVDFSIIAYGIPAVYGELAVHTGYVVWKSKAENMSKWNMKDNIQM